MKQTAIEWLIEKLAQNGVLHSSDIHQGIARRDFDQEFTLADHMEVTKAEFEDGLLTITVERILPEEKKPKNIPIK